VVQTVGAQWLLVHDSHAAILVSLGGRLVTLSAPPDADKAAALGLRAVFFVVKGRRSKAPPSRTRRARRC
jgi:hypothetical protein